MNSEEMLKYLKKKTEKEYTELQTQIRKLDKFFNYLTRKKEMDIDVIKKSNNNKSHITELEACRVVSIDREIVSSDIGILYEGILYVKSLDNPEKVDTIHLRLPLHLTEFTSRRSIRSVMGNSFIDLMVYVNQ